VTDRNRRQPGSPRESFADRRARHAEIDDPEIVLAAALRFLEVRQRSVTEVRRRLAQTGYQAELIEGAIEKLLGIEVPLRAQYIRVMFDEITRLLAHLFRGERALRRELQVKGIDRAIVDESMEARRPEPGGADDPDVGAAEALMRRHASALARVGDPRKRRQRAYALLARHGFDSEIASMIAARVTADPAPGEEPE